MAPTARGRELLSSFFRCALPRSANQRDAHRGRCRFCVKTSWEEEEAKKRFYGTSAPRPRGRGKPATTTRSSSFSSQDDHGSLRAKAKRRNPRMSVIEAVSAAIGSFAIGSVAAYLVEQQEEERQQQQQQQQQKEREEKEKGQNDTNEKEKKTKSSTWRIFKEAKAEAAASPAKRIRNGKICARNAVDERGSIETRVRASYKDNVCHVIDFLDNQPGRREA